MAEALVVGSGPNGLAAAIELARAGIPVVVVEAEDTPGGGMRSEELTLPGFLHDRCSAVHPLALASPFFRAIDLGVEWIHPGVPLAHPLDDGGAALLHRSVDETADGLGADAAAYRKLMVPIAASAAALVRDLLGPLRLPRHPLSLAAFGRRAVRAARPFARSSFEGDHARALFAGVAAHSMLSLDTPMTAGVGLTLTMLAHHVGWPVAGGGSRRIGEALVARLADVGGRVETGHRVTSLDELAQSATVLLDVTPRQLAAMAGDRLPARYRRRLARFRYGPGVFKVDWALDEPIPWKATECLQAGTVHVGGTLEEIAGAEAAVMGGDHPERPFIIVAQQSLFDPSRAPSGKHAAWAYCHVPNGSTVDMTERVEAQIERFAPGFRDVVLARATIAPADFERHNANYVGGDINGGMQDLRQHFARPVPSLNPYATPIDGVYLCSSSTPPGGGVHGMCGYHAARAALRRLA